MRGAVLIIALCAGLMLAGCGGGDDSSAAGGSSPAPENSKLAAEVGKKKPKIVVPSGPAPKVLEKNDLVVGTGREAKGGDEVTVHYVGVGYTSKKEFDASWGGEPFPFTLGTGGVIPGWEYGIPGMKVGGRRELVIPGALAYGPEGTPEIGPNETLIFVIDLLGVK
jgi:peptidylprolyl isomerase